MNNMLTSNVFSTRLTRMSLSARGWTEMNHGADELTAVLIDLTLTATFSINT